MTLYQFLAGSILLLSVLALALAFASLLSPAVALGLYLLLALFCAALWLRAGRGRCTGQATTGLIFLLFFPCLGLPASAFLLLYTLSYPPPEDGRSELGDDDKRLFDIRDRLMRPSPQAAGEESFLPAVTMLGSPDLEDRRSAIEVLARIGGPEQIAHLRKCLDDPEREVYQLAHAKLTALHERYTNAIDLAQQRSQEEELDGVVLYLHSGLLGEASKLFYRHKAITLAGKLLLESPQDSQLLSLLGELYLEDQKYREAALAFETSLGLEDSIEARWGLVRLCYQQRDYEAFLTHLREMKGLASATVPGTRAIVEAVTWWFGEAESAAVQG